MGQQTYDAGREKGTWTSASEKTNRWAINCTYKRRGAGKKTIGSICLGVNWEGGGRGIFKGG